MAGAAASCRDRAERTGVSAVRDGLVVCQLGWVGMLFVPESARSWVFPLLVLAELSVPVIAELRPSTSWHPHHIAERYGLFTLIVLGETVSAATIAVQEALDEHDELGDLLPLAAGGLLIVFAAWWIYFAVPIHDHLTLQPAGFRVGLRPLCGALVGRRDRRGHRGRGRADRRQGPHLDGGGASAVRSRPRCSC